MTTNNISIKAILNVDTSQADKSLDATKNKIKGVQQQAARPAAQTSAMSSAKKQMDKDDDLYRVTRGARGTGAEGRDFARQAQGLGGLVHVYATFAANLFAVSAAFGALKKAADTTNMIEGLNQLGAASGKNLGSMAKNIVSITDGAVSLRQAMEATAQATTGGMSGEQLERMTKIAKSASQALGRDMGDSLARLSRGITKIEPELLDEIGIMVRVDKAAADYARTLGKTSSSLTDFEKRQAFATAVLKQGEEKFSNIEISANPYAKLEASFLNLAQSGGELLNKVLGPIAKLLAESPTALTAVMTGVTSLLLGKAIPALTQWRGSVAQSAAEAASKARELYEVHESFQITKGLTKVKEELAPIEAEINERIASAQGLLAKSGLSSRSKIMQSATSDDFLRSEEGIKKNIADMRSAEQLKLNKINVASKALQSAEIQGDKELLKLAQEKIDKSKEELNYLKLARIEAENILEAEKNRLNISSAAHEKFVPDAAKYTSIESANKRRFESAQRRADKYSIYSQIGSNVDKYGVREAFDKVKEGVAEKKLQGIHKYSTIASGGLRVLGSAAITLASSLGSLFMVIGLIIGGFQLLNSFFTTNAKEQENYSKALESGTEALEGAGRTIELISKKDPLQQLTVESLSAKANALNEVSTSLNTIVEDFNKVTLSQSIWSDSLDSISSLWGGSLAQGLSKNVSESIVTSLKLASEGGAKEEAVKALKSLFGETSLTSVDDLTDKLLDLPKGQIDNTAKNISKILDKLSKDINNPVSNLKSGIESLTAASKDYDNTVNSLASNDSLSKMYLNSAKGMTQLLKATTETTQALSALEKVSGDISLLKAFTVGTTAVDIFNVGSRLKELKETEARLKADREKFVASGKNLEQSFGGPDAIQQYRTYSAGIAAIDKQLKESSKESEGLAKEFTGLLKQGVIDSVKELDKGLDRAKEKANISIRMEYLSEQQGSSAINEMAALRQREIDIQIEQIKSQESLVISQERLRITMEKGELSRLKRESGTTEYDTLIKQADSALDKLKTASAFKDLNLSNFSDNSFMLPIIAAQKGGQEKEAALNAQGTNIETKRQRDIIKDEFAQKQKTLSVEEGQAKNATKIAQTNIDVLGVYNEQLYRIRDIAKEEEKIIQEKIFQTKVEEALALHARDIKNTKNRTSADETLSRKLQELGAARSLQIFENEQAVQASILDTINKKTEAHKKQIDYATKYLDILSDLYNILDSTNLISEKDLKNARFNNEILKLQAQQKGDILEIEGKIEAATDAGKSASVIKALEDEKDLRVQLNADILKAKTLQHDYNMSLEAPREIMKEFERIGTGGIVGYVSSITDDLSNKLSALIKASKSAGEAFNDALLSSIDKMIDKFAELTVNGKLTFKSITEGFKETIKSSAQAFIAQSWKNSVNDIMKFITGPTEADKKAEGVQSHARAMEAHTNALLTAAGVDTNNIKTDTENTKTNSQVASLWQKLTDKNTSITDKFAAVLDFFKAGIDKLLGSLLNLGGREGSTSILGSIGSTLKQAGSGALDWIREAGSAVARAFGFSKGGILTSPSLSAHSNSIVSSPTMFAFAKGAGLMGEAGPEAIIPLKRDAKGNLGIRSSGNTEPTTTVIVNNYGNEKATTKETVDSRGNKSIEVVIGDAVSSEIKRPNSSLNRTMQNSYGARPVLTQR